MSETIKRNTPDEIIAVVEAFKRGEVIQSREIIRDDVWTDNQNPCWNFPHVNYRPKPKPREFWINTYYGGRNAVMHVSQESAEENRTQDCHETIHVREVTE